MGLDLPAGLDPLLAGVRASWPAIDEDALHAAAQHWHTIAAALRERGTAAGAAIRDVVAGQAGQDVHALAEHWAGGPASQLDDAALAAEAIGAALQTTAAVVLELKAMTIAQLGILAARLCRPASTPDALTTLADRAAALAATRTSLRLAGRSAHEVLDGPLVRVLGAAEHTLRTALAAVR
ncbi:MAG TPA: hypothetical protein VLJ59_10605 [Mycobacteriales bacterium]|nr:hypothetical protein [Mycobacteriales bacterium]